MAEQNTLPGLVKEVAKLRKDVYELQRRKLPSFAPSSARLPVPFSFPGTVVDDVESGPWYPAPGFPVTFISCRVSALVSGSGTTTIELRVNGSPLQSVNLGSGAITVTADTAIAVGESDYFTVKTTAVGSGLADLTVEMSVA